MLNPNSLAARDVESVLHPATNFRRHIENGPLVVSRANGIYVYDDDGRDYIEGLAGLWCTALGYGVGDLAEVAREQMEQLSFAHLFGGKSHEPSIALAEKLKELSPTSTDKVFFGNSGSDANDTQIKLVRYFNNARGKPDKKKIISRKRAYHGVTIGSGSLTGLPVNHAFFDLPIPGILHTETPDLYREGLPGESDSAFADRLADALEALIVAEDPDTVAAFIAEPVMGAGGVIVPPQTYFPKIEAVLRRHDVMLIDDEVICGFGRTGQRFGAETFEMNPDTVSIAKGLSSAYLPISAVLVPDWLYDTMVQPSDELGVFGHGFTYSGHPVSCAVALKNLELMEEWNILGHVTDVAPHFQSRLRSFREHPLVGEARGVGLIGALEFVADKDTKQGFETPGRVGRYCAERCQEHGLIIRAIGDIIAFCPPLIIDEPEIDEMFERFTHAIDETLDWIAASS